MDRLFQQVLQHLLEHRNRHQLGHHFLDQLGRVLRQVIQQLLHLTTPQQTPGVKLHQVVQVRGHHGGGIHHGVAGCLRHVLFRRLDPVGVQAEGRIAGLHAVQAHVGMAGVDGQPHARIGLTGTHRHALQADAIVVRTQVKLVAHVNWRRQETDFLGKLAAHTLDAHQQVTPVGLVHQLDQLVSHFQAQNVHRLHILPGGIAVACSSRHHFLGRCRSLLRRHRQLEGDIAQHGSQ